MSLNLPAICKNLEDFQVKRITQENFSEVMKVYDSNSEFFLLTEGKTPDKDKCMQDITAVPNGFAPQNKYFFGIWDGQNIVGVCDVLAGYPSAESIWIGLLLIDGKLHGRQVGSRIVSALLKAAIENRYVSVQLGVVETNQKGVSFWSKMGFQKIRESEMVREQAKPPQQKILC